MKRKSLLEREISEASQKYYTDGTSNLSDAQFDRMISELKVVDPSNPLITAVGHGYDVSKDTTYGEKVKHKYGIVGSLDKTHSWDELSDDLKNVPVVCSLKLDGISCVLYYEKSNLVRALTRGDGNVGIDVTEKILVIAPHMKSLPLSEFTGAVRGELVMRFDKFNEYKKVHSDAKNPRNTVAGLINRKQYNKEDLRLVSLVLYSILASNKVGYVHTYVTFMKTLSSMCSVAPYELVMSLSESTFDETMAELHTKFESDSKLPNDGMVIASNYVRTDKYEGSEELVTSWKSQAYKFPAEKKQTVVTSVEWNLTKTGYVVPKIKFNKISLSGTDVEYATAFNAKYVEENKLQPGTVVTITKSGEIIPYIVSIDSTPDMTVLIPATCPSCGEPLAWNGVHLMCENVNCHGKSMMDAVIWMKTISPVDGLSDTLIEKYLSDMKVFSVKDIYNSSNTFVPRASSKQDELFKKSWDGCFNNEVSLATAVRACNVPRFGDKTCDLFNNKQIANSLLQTLKINYVTAESENQLKCLGKANFDSLVANFSKIRNVLYILDNVYVPDQVYKEFKGNVCVTGKLSVKRKDFESELVNAGYNPVSSVTSTTSFLVTDNPNSGSSKNKAADKYGIPKVTEEEFRHQYL